MAASIIIPGLKINGEITGTSELKVEGEIHGKISLENNILIEKSGHVEAEIIADNITISGEVSGNITARETVEITAEGRVRGEITTPVLNIAKGAFFCGAIEMDVNSTSTSAEVLSDDHHPLSHRTGKHPEFEALGYQAGAADETDVEVPEEQTDVDIGSAEEEVSMEILEDDELVVDDSSPEGDVEEGDSKKKSSKKKK